MMYPRFIRRRLSSARFFSNLPPPRKGQSRLKRGKLELTLPFYLQLFVSMLVLAALLFPRQQLKSAGSRGLGVWFMVDTSASMTTRQEQETRWDAAVRAVEQGIRQIRQSAGHRQLCFRLSVFDLERRDILLGGNETEIRQALQQVQPRPLGTNLGLIRSAFQLPEDRNPNEKQCRVSHMVVITDMPFPGWLLKKNGPDLIWQDIGKQAVNVGLTEIHAVRNPLTGMASEVTVAAKYYGQVPVQARLIVTAPNNDRVKDIPLKWQTNRYWQGSFTPMGSGRYRLEVTPGGAYSFDDRAVIILDKGREIRVDWQLPHRQIPRQMGWKEDKDTPHFRVTAEMNNAQGVPTLIVGPGYPRSRPASGNKETEPAVIHDFIESSPLLADINLDVVESLGLRGLELPQDFNPVLRGMDGRVWLAQAKNPLRAYVPGLPTGTGDTLGRFSTAVFFNAIRWLLQERDIQPLYTLTSPYTPEPADNRLVLHKDEGNTWKTDKSSGKLTDIEAIEGKGLTVPLWPILMMAAVVLFSIERMVAVYRR